MSNFDQLVAAIALLIGSFGSLIVLRPRHGVPFRWVTVPLVGPTVSILIVTGFVVGAVLLAGYFTTIDNVTLTGATS